MSKENQIRRIKELHRNRSKSTIVRFSFLVLLAVIAWSWTAKSLHESLISKEQRSLNLQKFLEKIIPDPTRESGKWGDSLPWIFKNIHDDQGLIAGLMTFGLATTAIWISGILAFMILPMASKNLATHQPLGIIVSNNKLTKILWVIVNRVSRMLFLFARSLPEYVLGFLLLSILGPDPWTLVLALAIHNFGILGRLGSEIIENNNSETPKVFIYQGSGRFNSFIAAMVPESFSRMLMYYFYRWETCVRESTVLGMLGIASLGFMISEAKAGRDFDKMILLILFGSLIVILGDILSYWVRNRLRLDKT